MVLGVGGTLPVPPFPTLDLAVTERELNPRAKP
jgi:hypothetical protein